MPPEVLGLSSIRNKVNAAPEDIYDPIIRTLSACRRVLVTTHIRPDGDALGSAAAMVLALRARGIAAEVLLLSHLPSKYAFIFENYGIAHFDAEKGWPEQLMLDSYDALLVVDTGTWSQLPGLRERLEAFTKPRLVVDHHLTQESWATHKLVVTEAGAAGEIVAELIEQWGVELTPAIATCLFVAVVTDTGWFQFSNTRPFTLRLGAMLLEAGVDMDGIYKRLYQNERPQRVRLQSLAMQSLELLAGGRLAVMTITRDAFAESGAGVPDTENLINIPLQIREVEVSILVTEPLEGGPIRISLRSKGAVDCAKAAEEFGGGGHARAAGLKLDLPLQEARAKVVDVMSSCLAGSSSAKGL